MLSDKEERFRSSLLRWGEENLREFPWRESDRSLYEIFVAEFFLTQTPADNVDSIYLEFLEQYPSLDAIDEASEQELAEAIRPIGFHNMRAEALKEIAAKNDALPDTATDLVALPRVGEYVTNATLCFACAEPLPVIDRNVDRVYRRVFGDEWPDTLAAQSQFAARLVPEERPREYNLALLDFGALVCKPEPLCETCFATDYCEYYAVQR